MGPRTRKRRCSICQEVGDPCSVRRYPRSVFPDQTSFDPWKPDAGNGVASSGTLYRADPFTAYEAWSQSRLKTWLSTLPSLGLVPNMIAAGNELDICASTHRDAHWDKATYAELLKRVKDTADTVRSTAGFEAVQIAAPSSCCWWACNSPFCLQQAYPFTQVLLLEF